VRRLAIGLAIALGIAVVATLGIVLGLNRLIEANRTRIVAGISRGFARPVDVERITATFHGGIAIQLDGLRIADDPAFAQDDFLVAEHAYAVLRLWPLLQRRIDVRRIAVRAPRLTVIRTANGVNVDSLGRRPGTGPRRAPAAPTDEPAARPAFAVTLVNLEGGVVRYVDRTGPTPSETTIDPLNVRLSDLSLATPMRLEVEATTTAPSPVTVRVHGVIGPVGDPPFAADVPIEQRVAVKAAAVEVADLAITGRLRRTAAGTPIASVRIAAPSIHASGVELTGFEASAAEADGVTTLERLAFRALGGAIEGTGRVDRTGAAARFGFETTVRDLDVSRALASRAPDLAARYEGRLDGTISLSGTAGDETTVRRSLAGTGRVVVRNGRLKGVNVAESVLGAAGIQGIVTLVPVRVRDRYPAIFATDDTRFDELSSDVRLAGERIHVESMNVVARDYAIRGKGFVTFAQDIDLTATLYASAALTADVIGMLREAHVLTDATGRLGIPFRFAGRLPNVRPKPDVEFIGRVLQKALVDEGLGRLLGGGGGKPSGPKKRSRGDDDLLQKGLDKLFKR
jgi:hypothetical protein